MKTFNKSLHPLDYGEPGIGLWLYAFDQAVDSRSIPYMPNPHLHRRWEYGMAMEFLKALGGPEAVPRILDVGGAGSLFGAIAMSAYYDVTVVDPDPCVHMMAGQRRATLGGGGKGRSICADFMEWGITQNGGVDSVEEFDVVLSLSTIEHVDDDVAFIQKLQKHARKGLFLTTDFSMTGAQWQPGHLRTYTPKTMQNKLARALDPEWKYHGEPEWIENGPWVMGYDFASLGMVIFEEN